MHTESRTEGMEEDCKGSHCSQRIGGLAKEEEEEQEEEKKGRKKDEVTKDEQEEDAEEESININCHILTQPNKATSKQDLSIYISSELTFLYTVPQFLKQHCIFGVPTLRLFVLLVRTC
jgi:hypothetical protein